MNIIFLDIDGVLESIDWRIRKFNETGSVVKGKDRLDPVCLNHLKTIVESTQAKIVVTSAWKNCKTDLSLLEDIFKDYDLEIYDVTKQYFSRRGKEIREWLTEHTGISNYIIIDDDYFKDYNGLDDHLVMPSVYRGGLNDTHVRKAIELLKGAK